MTSKFVVFALLFVVFSTYSQSLSGKVIDSKTGQPIVTASVYFDNSTVGTTTDDNGEFSIDYSEAIQSTLVISFLGYQTVYIADYRERRTISVGLTAAKNQLDEVYIAYDDGLTRRQKLNLFKKELLGTTRFGKSCKILNEDDIYLRYLKTDKTLVASSNSPIVIYNRALNYEIQYDLNDFELQFTYANPATNEFTFKSGYFFGTIFFRDLSKTDQRKSTLRKREKAFKGSIQHFMRALYNENLKSQDYTIFKKGFVIDPKDVFEVQAADSTGGQKRVKLKSRISILYKKDRQSDLYLAPDVEEFLVDAYGNYIPIIGVYFTGYMNQLRVGDMLPSDYGLRP